MTRHDSDSELSGRVAPQRPRVVHLPARGAQNSGFFDLDALFPINVEQIRKPPTVRAPSRPPPLPPRASRGMPQLQIVEVPRRVAARGATRRQPIGWFAVFVAWLAMVTTAALVTTQLSGHARVRTHIAAPALAPAPALVPAPAPATATATATATASGPPVVAFSDLPKSLPASRTPRVRHAAAPSTPAPKPTEDTDAPSLPPVKTVVVAIPPPPTPAAAPAAPSPPASNGTPSLEDLIRREVAAEQKRVHDASRK
jgi:hypothetical protein